MLLLLTYLPNLQTCQGERKRTTETIQKERKREKKSKKRNRQTKLCKIIMQETISKHMLQKHTQTIYEWAGPQLCDCTTTALGSQGGDYSEGKLGNQFVS